MRRTRLAKIFCSALLLASPAIAHDAENAKPAQPLPGAALPTGKFTLTLKRVGDGPWLIFSDMDNTSAPPRAR